MDCGSTREGPPAPTGQATGARPVLRSACGPAGLLSRLWGALATALCVLYTALLGAVACGLAALGLQREVAAVSRLWGRLIILTCGVKVEVEGLEKIAGLKSLVLVANHQSAFDIFALLARMPGTLSFVAKKELVRIPLVGYALKHGGHIIIDRQQGGRAIRKGIEAARRGSWICVFAEGRRYTDGRVHEFSDGAAWLASAARLPCVPVAISGSGAFFPRGALVVRPGCRMRIRVLDPVETAHMAKEERAALTRRLEEAVRGALVAEL